ncbi:MAG: hypothetical protein KJN64_08775 [Ignavibacteria bacterium]|nr:hypothetical protein [Ignavibacteria bacterium]MBT8383814.1 hypothetical protein [Ignavibacteria bacterium]MBT8391583.1 hypothetical protein [Ignavibacteria bacterium]NNJ53716.1 hypothetical protein [Ignavibacteriaceae bacterium]NNL20780.1 hypothetical protein [Ignavibacteriaceae bacterium]
MGILSKIFGKSNKVRVQLIDSSNGNTISISKIPPAQLPETFEIHTTMHLKNEDWSIEEAIPADSKDFLESRELILKVKKIKYMNPEDLLFTIPTVSNEIPQTFNSSLFNDFEYSILEDEWRQNEFLNKSSLPLVEIEIKKIEELKINDSKKVDSDFTAFKNCHVRDTIGEPKLNLDLQSIKNILSVNKVGSLKISNEFVKNGFSLKTDSTIFYGTAESGIVTQFCIGKFSDNTSNEIQDILDEFKLLFVSWYHCRIIAPNE